MNVLALIELIRNEKRAGMPTLFIDALVKFASDLGIPDEEVEDALNSDRGLVIYEP